MKNAIQLFEYEGQQVEFDFGNDNIMVNATEMASIYGKRLDNFLENQSTKEFINALKFPLNGGNLSPLSDEEIIITKGRSGTWMHRMLALKFAAWLDPKFEVWVYGTIDKLMFGSIKEDARQKSKIDKQRDELHERLLANPEYAELIGLENSQKYLKKKLNQQFKNQVLLFS